MVELHSTAIFSSSALYDYLQTNQSLMFNYVKLLVSDKL